MEIKILRASNAQEYRNRKFLERVTLKNIELEILRAKNAQEYRNKDS